MAPMPVTLNDLGGNSLVAELFKCNSLTICVAFYKISNDTVCSMVLSDSWASCHMMGTIRSGTCKPPSHDSCANNHYIHHATLDYFSRIIYLTNPENYCI